MPSLHAFKLPQVHLAKRLSQLGRGALAVGREIAKHKEGIVHFAVQAAAFFAAAAVCVGFGPVCAIAFTAAYAFVGGALAYTVMHGLSRKVQARSGKVLV